jgi:hypothetical protein
MEVFVLYFTNEIGVAHIKGVFDTVEDAMTSLNMDFIGGSSHQSDNGYYHICRARIGSLISDDAKNVVFSKRRENR